jgi:hypothetical protein
MRILPPAVRGENIVVIAGSANHWTHASAIPRNASHAKILSATSLAALSPPRGARRWHERRGRALYPKVAHDAQAVYLHRDAAHRSAAWRVLPWRRPEQPRPLYTVSACDARHQGQLRDGRGSGRPGGARSVR